MGSSSNGNGAILWGALVVVVLLCNSMNSLARSLDHSDAQSPQEAAYEVVSEDESKISVNIITGITYKYAVMSKEDYDDYKSGDAERITFYCNGKEHVVSADDVKVIEKLNESDLAE